MKKSNNSKNASSNPETLEKTQPQSPQTGYLLEANVTAQPTAPTSGKSKKKQSNPNILSGPKAAPPKQSSRDEDEENESNNSSSSSSGSMEAVCINNNSNSEPPAAATTRRGSTASQKCESGGERSQFQEINLNLLSDLSDESNSSSSSSSSSLSSPPPPLTSIQLQQQQQPQHALLGPHTTQPNSGSFFQAAQIVQVNIFDIALPQNL